MYVKPSVPIKGRKRKSLFLFIFFIFIVSCPTTFHPTPNTAISPAPTPGSSLRRLTAAGLSRSAAPFSPWGNARFFVLFFFPLLGGTTTLFPFFSSLIWVCSWSSGIALWIGLGTVAWFRRMGHCAVRAGAGRFSRLIYCRCYCWWNLYIWGISLSLLVNWWLSKSAFENPLSFLEFYITC